MNVRDIAELVHGEILGDPLLPIVRAGTIENGHTGEVVFLSNPKYAKFLTNTAATAILVPLAAKGMAKVLPGRAFIFVENPHESFAVCLRQFAKAIVPFASDGIHPTAVISPSASIGVNVQIGAYCVVAERVKIGSRTVLHPGVKIAADVKVGEDCLVEANTVICHGSQVGDRVILRAGCVIGSEGFGHIKGKDGRYQHIPQLGIVVLGDEVDIGSNASVARATAGETRIGRGVKVDCLVQIGHNTTIGENTAFAAQCGIGGSTKIGKDCVFGGQVGIHDHLEIADNSSFGAQAGVTKTIREPGGSYLGYPAVKLAEGLRRYGAFAKLPGMWEELRAMRKELRELREQLAKLSKPS